MDVEDGPVGLEFTARSVAERDKKEKRKEEIVDVRLE
jgi:hypothetical protein